jgi:dihydropyrimidinase
MDNIRRAQGKGLPVYAETCPQYLNLTWDDLVSLLKTRDQHGENIDETAETIPFPYMLREQQARLLATSAARCVRT